MGRGRARGRGSGTSGRPGGPGARALGGAALVAAGAELLHLAPAAVRLPPVRRLAARRTAGYGDPRHVALTFDDGPDPRGTPEILDALDALGLRATFFLLGTMLERAPGLGRELVTRGHEVAVHGWYHRRQWYPDPARDLRELRRVTEAVTDLCGARPSWYRPPYGVLAAGQALAAHRLGLRTVLWTTWGRDWVAGATGGSVYGTARAGLTGGATLLLHDSDCTSAPGSWRATLDALPLIADHCRDRALRLGPLRDHGVPAPGPGGRHRSTAAPPGTPWTPRSP
ncbi:polysaccharide deacetylase family protein [Streptomyces sp. BE303]|uniref:polysaccharide deacetylase family protein n=1 Tax=Streptomyces sp. BE303 TaxID=3002528 RepID=UPI002E78FB8F|nr:polysaccharide deacetylase family protein [Streptomyces sp. BE303]MED7953818.1 polysaccharide deacetylase family protein [Streptomyces sp. BE303]